MLMTDAPLTSGEPSLEDIRLDEYLSDWAEYHQAPSGELREPNHSPVLAGGWYSKSVEEMYERDVMIPRCKAIETIVHEDIAPAQRAAILHRYRFAVYKFPRGNYPQLLQDARHGVIRGLRLRHLWIL